MILHDACVYEMIILLSPGACIIVGGLKDMEAIEVEGLRAIPVSGLAGMTVRS